MHGARSTTITPTWAQLVKLEPRLAALLDEARQADGSDEHFCANRVWAGALKIGTTTIGLIRAGRHWTARSHSVSA